MADTVPLNDVAMVDLLVGLARRNTAWVRVAQHHIELWERAIASGAVVGCVDPSTLKDVPCLTVVYSENESCIWMLPSEYAVVALGIGGDAPNRLWIGDTAENLLRVAASIRPLIQGAAQWDWIPPNPDARSRQLHCYELTAEGEPETAI